MFVLRCVSATRVGMCKMHPHFKVAVLIFFHEDPGCCGRQKTHRASVPAIFHGSPGCLRNPRTPAHSHGTALGLGPGGIDRSVSVNSSSIIQVVFSIVAAWAAPSGTFEVPSNQVHMLLLYHSADCKW